MESNHLSFEELLDYLLSQGKEGEFWDFKREWHSKIEDLIKDIIERDILIKYLSYLCMIVFVEMKKILRECV